MVNITGGLSLGNAGLTLSNHIDILSKTTPGLSINAVSMGNSLNLRSGVVNFRVDHETSFVDHSLVSTLDDIAEAVHQN